MPSSLPCAGEFADPAQAAPPVRLVGLGHALPPHELPQPLVRGLSERIFGPRRADYGRLARAFDTAGIDRRWSVAPPEWFETPRNWAERSELYVEGAVALFADAARRALAASGLAAEEIDAVVTVSSTGIATPSLEARAFSDLGFRSDVHRVPLFGLGCAGGVTGLAIAARLARASPGSRVLLVCVETCTLNIRQDRAGKADVIAAILFGDGAAAACLTSGDAAAPDAPWIGEGVEHLWPDTLGIMGWDVEETGLGVIFDRSIPDFLDRNFAEAADAALTRAGLTGEAAGRLVCHPGGARVLEAIERALGFPPESLDHEREVLRECGNMSAPTVLFVLERVLAREPAGPLTLAALGPGFTLSLLPLRPGGET